MMKSLIWIRLCSVLMIAFVLIGADSKKTYELIEPQQPTSTGNKVEVVEVFWYGCPHCYSIEPHIEKWLSEKPDYIEFVRLPAVLGQDWIAHAKVFYVAQEMGVLEKIHRPLFNAIHNKHQRIIDEKSLRKFFIAQGVDGNEFDRLLVSEEIDQKLRRAFVLGRNYGITSVPAIIVNGKYLTNTTMTGGSTELMQVVSDLANKEYQSMNQ